MVHSHQGRLLGLYAQAVQVELIDDSEATRLAFTSLAQHVLNSRPENAGGLFHQLLRRQCFHFVTHAEEDAAQQRLKEHLYTMTTKCRSPSQHLIEWSVI